MKRKVFFYGTLMKPFHNFLVYVQPLIATRQAAFLYQGITTERYPLMVHTDRNVPALYNNEGIGQYVEGEVWEVSDQGIEALDIIEGVSSGFYSTGQIKVSEKEKTGTNAVFDNCYVYFKGSNPHPLSLSHPLRLQTTSLPSPLGREENEILQWLKDKIEMSEVVQINKDVVEEREIVNGAFLNCFTSTLHEGYTINRLFPEALAKACNVSIDKVNSLIDSKQTQDIIGEGKSKRELQTVYAELWKELVDVADLEDFSKFVQS